MENKVKELEENQKKIVALLEVYIKRIKSLEENGGLSRLSI
jgi:hypothetical protein